MRRIILWAMVLSVICSATNCRRRPPAPTPGTAGTSATSSTTAANSPAGANLQITPLGAGHNEMAEILGMQMWRFHVICDSPGALLFHTIGLRQNGQRAQEISGGLSRWPDSRGDTQMVVALYPLDGDLHTSDKLKTYVRIGGTKSSSIRDNPLKGRYGTTTLSVARRQEDGSFLLMQSSGGAGDPAENTLQLVLRVYASETGDTSAEQRERMP